MWLAVTWSLVHDKSLAQDLVGFKSSQKILLIKILVSSFVPKTNKKVLMSSRVPYLIDNFYDIWYNCDFTKKKMISHDEAI